MTKGQLRRPDTTSPISDAEGNVTTFIYDDLDRMVALTPELSSAGILVEYEYNKLGQVTKLTRCEDLSETTVSLVKHQRFNSFGVTTATLGSDPRLDFRYALNHDSLDSRLHGNDGEGHTLPHSAELFPEFEESNCSNPAA